MSEPETETVADKFFHLVIVFAVCVAIDHALHRAIRVIRAHRADEPN